MEKLDLNEDEWRARLSPVQYHVLREAGTERAFSGALNVEKRDGAFHCGGCGTLLFQSESKRSVSVHVASLLWPRNI